MPLNKDKIHIKNSKDVEEFLKRSNTKKHVSFVVVPKFSFLNAHFFFVVSFNICRIKRHFFYQTPHRRMLGLMLAVGVSLQKTTKLAVKEYKIID